MFVIENELVRNSVLSSLNFLRCILVFSCIRVEIQSREFLNTNKLSLKVCPFNAGPGLNVFFMHF